MIHIYRQLETVASNELLRLNITGTVLSVRFIYTNYIPMLRITFRSSAKLSVKLTELERIERDEEEKDLYYLYSPIDTQIQVK